MPISTIGANGLGSGAVTNAKIDTMAATKLTGQVPDANAPSGSVLQVVQAVKTDTSSVTGTTFVDISGLSLSITPISSSNTILLIVTLNGCVNTTNNISFNLVRNSTAIAQPVGGGTYNSTINLFNNGPGAQSTGITFLDSPATTAATTYKIQWRVDAGTGLINRHTSGTNYNAVSSITAMEIAA